jgi:hypothetical protein
MVREFRLAERVLLPVSDTIMGRRIGATNQARTPRRIVQAPMILAASAGSQSDQAWDSFVVGIRRRKSATIGRWSEACRATCVREAKL